ncbi:unnamed protein product [Cochlearia groenlandica]
MAVDRSLAYKWTVRYLIVVVMVTNIVEPMAEKVNHSGQRNQEIELMLKQLNKQALKSIKSSSGEIIDCVSITKQPTFDHPMLINHTIQMKPSSYPHKVVTKEDASNTSEQDQENIIAQPWQLEGDCPENTIPIKRITKEDLLRTDYIKHSHKNISRPHHHHHHATSILGGGNGHEYAIAYTKGIFRGARAKINVWKPRVQQVGEFSVSQIWVLGGNFDSTLNSIEAGAMVNPALYGDSNPRLFTYWTGDGYQKTGCYNLRCPGFIQINKRISLGAPLNPISTYNGPQYLLMVQIWKDPKTENWWLQLNNKDLIGYWPRELFPNLANGANTIEWGGEIVNLKEDGQHTTTEMGSGHFSSEGYKKASHFEAVEIIDMNDGILDPVGIETLVTRPTCYDIKTGYSKPWGFFFHYGGPGRNPNCP